MDEYAVEVVARHADGRTEPFRIYIGVPEAREGYAECLVWFPLVKQPVKLGGDTLEQAYDEAFAFVRRMVHYSDLTLEDRDGRPFVPSRPSS